MALHDFGSPDVARGLLKAIHADARRCGRVKIMEVCGTHTMEIGRLGLRALLPDTVELVSGPGCPVCVTPGAVIDAAARCATGHAATVLTFGDMIRVPGDITSLSDAKAAGGAIEVVTSPLQAVTIAESRPKHPHVFIAVGFETTIPTVARAVTLAAERGVDNLSFLVCHRLVPPALDVLLADEEVGIRAFLLPGHVSAIIGTHAYSPVATAGIPAAITGFEPLDILGGIQAVLSMLVGTPAEVVNRYGRVVRAEGNIRARELIEEVFEPVDALWRGIGVIPRSGLALRQRYARFDATRAPGVAVARESMPKGCGCGDVLKGIIRPDQCPLFAGACTPETPRGPCMVSSEGSCAAYYKYEVR
jgi:hydrogenase expression/formation protein HypD